MTFVPRDYQAAAKTAVLAEWEDVMSTLVVQPTGTGKTCLFSIVLDELVRNTGKRAMVIAHREELIWQARTKIEAITGLDCGIEMGELSISPNLFGRTPVVVSTIQTQNSSDGVRKRMGRFVPDDFAVLIIDEAHHATSVSYKNLINYFKVNNPSIKILGVTATPDRTDEEALGQIFDTVAFDYEILDAINDGWLVPIEQQFVATTIDWSAIRTTAGDLNGADLAAVMEAEENMQCVAGASIEILGAKKAMIFTASVKQAETVSNILNRHRSGMSAWVCGETNKDERRSINQRFEGGDIQVLCNCGVYTEGYDNPLIEVIIMAKPTKSRSLYAQMVGRGTRALPGVVDGPPTAVERLEAIAASAKPSCLVVDFVGNSGKHKLITTADILGGKVSDEILNRAVARAKKAGGPVRMADAIAEETNELIREMEKRRLEEEARKSKVLAKVNYSARSVSPFDLFKLTPTKERGWDAGKVLTIKQSELLRKQGFNPDELGYTKGKQVLGELFSRWKNNLATVGQLKVLSRHGYNDPKITFAKASELISAIAKNGWKRPT
jgi:superfamily II DNA or RNA helicase